VSVQLGAWSVDGWPMLALGAFVFAMAIWFVHNNDEE
jgi:hypothetical protein